MPPVNAINPPHSTRSGLTSLSLWRRAALFAVAYFACAEAGIYLSVPHTTYVSFWLPAGLYIAVLLQNPTRDWPVLMLAILPANLAFDLIHGTPLALIPFFYFANTLQSGLGAWLTRRFVVERPTLATLKEFTGLILFGAVLSTMLGAVVGAATLTASGLSPSFFESWKVWWGSCGMAVLLFSPMILTWCHAPAVLRDSLKQPARLVEAALLLVVLFLLTWQLLFFDQGIMSPNKGRMVVPLMWAGLRFGPRGSATATFLMSLLIAFFTTQYFKGLTPDQIASGEYVFIMQATLAVAALLGLIPAIIIGERDRTMSQLHESEERYRNLTAAAFEGICISENGRIVDVNDQMLKMFGYERAEMIGLEIVQVVAPESRPEVAGAVAAGRESIYGHRLLRKDGSSFYAEARARMVRVGDRTVRMTALRDITDRKLAEQALRESEEKFSKAFHAGPDVMSITDLETGCYLEVNDVHERLFGYTRAEVIGRSPAELGLINDSVDREKLRAELETQGAIRDVEIEARNRKGEILTLLHSAELVQLQGRRCVLRVSHDITARKQTEQALHESEARRIESIEREQQARVEYTFQLIASQEAERSRIAGELHDSLGQNLLLIKNRAQLALPLSEASPLAQEQLEGIRDVAALSIAEVRQISHDLRPYQLDHLGLTRALEAMIDQLAQSTNIVFERHLDDLDHGFALESITNLYRIAQECLNNIVKHSHATHAFITLERDVHHIRLWIKDDGHGFAFAASGPGTPSGLGLKNIAERARILHGTVRIESHPGAGTEIEVLVPLPEESPA